MLRVLADENLDGDLLRGIRRELPTIDLVRVQDVGLMGKDDPIILEWAAEQGRILITHDAQTMTKYAYERVQASKAMPGVIELRMDAPIGILIEHIVLAVQLWTEEELDSNVFYLPLR
jgi:predicted nuclease of predicted toxin-antitoxin system